jgi:hypothetical protein
LPSWVFANTFMFLLLLHFMTGDTFGWYKAMMITVSKCCDVHHCKIILPAVISMFGNGNNNGSVLFSLSLFPFFKPVIPGGPVTPIQCSMQPF